MGRVSHVRFCMCLAIFTFSPASITVSAAPRRYSHSSRFAHTANNKAAYLSDIDLKHAVKHVVPKPGKGRSTYLTGGSSLGKDACPTYPLKWVEDPAKNDAKGRAAIFTPHHITYGGGEKYVLQAASVLQSLGYELDVLIRGHSICQSKDCLASIIEGLRVPLSVKELRLITLDVVGTKLTTKRRYDVFFVLGNEKYPAINPLGTVNIFMCQFPFDLDEKVPTPFLKVLDLYDLVLVNSQFTYSWYLKFTQSLFEAARQQNLLFPSVEILHPPVDPFEAGTDVRKNIVLLGRFFEGRQSKGHLDAIRIFRKVLPHLPNGTELHLIGNLWPGHEPYLQKLRSASQGLPVFFDVAVSQMTMGKILQKALVLWHLTGNEISVDVDPASVEHFGIAIAEGMSAGCIPVVNRKGGVLDIVTHNMSGFLAESEDEFGSYTRKLFDMKPRDIQIMRDCAIEKVREFHPSEFARKLKTMIHKEFHTRILKSFIRQTSSTVLSRSFNLPRSSTQVAVMIEPRPHYAMEYVVKNVMAHLGPGWSLHVFHGRLNGNFTRTVLRQVLGVQYTELDTDALSIPYYNKLLKSLNFWRVFRAKKALLFQADSLMVRGLDNDVLQYDYVGAPWHLENERWTNAIPEGVGNGGFSLRSVQAMLDIIAKHGSKSNTDEQEDMFFAGYLVNSTAFSVAPREKAYSFCVEVPCPDIEARMQQAHIPSAVHAAWFYYDDDPVRLRQFQSFLELSLCPRNY